MGTVLLFSGGLDSTTLTWDVLRNPFRYGLSPRKDEPVHLLTYTTGNPAEKAEQLATLVRLSQDLDTSQEVVHTVVKIPEPMESFSPDPKARMGSTRMLGPNSVSGFSSDARRAQFTPFTPGLHLFLVSVAVNLLWVPRNPFHGESQILAGFQYEPPTWDEHLRGTLTHTDTSPYWVEAVNKVLSVSSSEPDYRMRFLAPFLDYRLSKYDILRLAKELGVPLDETSSCEEGWQRNCGYCGACLLRAQTEALLQRNSNGE